MKVIVGSKNPAKVDAVRELLKLYDCFESFSTSGVSVESRVSDQPMSLDETIHGAVNRAKGAFNDCDYSIGIEGGLVSLEYDGKERLMNFCAAVFYDGSNLYLGISSGFELPQGVAKHINKGENLNDSMRLSGLTENNVGTNTGAIGVLTNGRLPRKEYTQQALMNALIHIENNYFYED